MSVCAAAGFQAERAGRPACRWVGNGARRMEGHQLVVLLSDTLGCPTDACRRFRWSTTKDGSSAVGAVVLSQKTAPHRRDALVSRTLWCVYQWVSLSSAWDKATISLNFAGALNRQAAHVGPPNPRGLLHSILTALPHCDATRSPLNGTDMLLPSPRCAISMSGELHAKRLMDAKKMTALPLYV